MYDGYVLFCTSASLQQCLSRKHHSCEEKETEVSEKIKEGSIVFLYNLNDKSLLGPFTALTEGAAELDAGAWAMNIDENIIPYADVQVTWENLHIIQNAPEQLPFLKEPKTCRLTTTQTQRVLDLLKQGQLYINVKDKKE
jgi:hypothetical protein